MCRDCEFGACMKGFWGAEYLFKEAHRKRGTVRYNLGEFGCRTDEAEEKERKCLANNFSEFKKFSEEA